MRDIFRKQLVAIRHLRGWTQLELAKKCGMHPAAISHYEDGRRLPTMKNLIKLADGINCPADYFYGKG